MRNIRSTAVRVVSTLWICGLSLLAQQENICSAAQPQEKATVVADGATMGGRPLSGETPTVAVAKRGIYVVRTVWQGTPLSDVRVEWRRRIEDTAPFLVGDTKRIGTANFNPSSGAYFLTADWRQDGNFARPRRPGDRFAWFGGNPWLVSSENSEVITLMLEEVPAPPTSVPPSGTGIYGRVTIGGAPVAGVGVYAYASTGSGFKSDDFQATALTNALGEFSFALPPARYYIVARRRADNSVDVGPLHKGDLLGYDPGSPVVVVQGHYSASAVPMVKLLQIKSRAESAAFPPGTIAGRIADRDGQPVEGAYAAVYQSPKMTGMPVFVSERTDASGRFALSVPVPGNYFLCARSGYGKPIAGAWFGAWGGSSDHSIAIKFGEEQAGLEIVVDRLTQSVEH